MFKINENKNEKARKTSSTLHMLLIINEAYLNGVHFPSELNVTYEYHNISKLVQFW